MPEHQDLHVLSCLQREPATSTRRPGDEATSDQVPQTEPHQRDPAIQGSAARTRSSAPYAEYPAPTWNSWYLGTVPNLVRFAAFTASVPLPLPGVTPCASDWGPGPASAWPAIEQRNRAPGIPVSTHRSRTSPPSRFTRPATIGSVLTPSGLGRGRHYCQQNYGEDG
jgi:hypothetical protein